MSLFSIIVKKCFRAADGANSCFRTGNERNTNTVRRRLETLIMLDRHKYGSLQEPKEFFFVIYNAKYRYIPQNPTIESKEKQY